MIKATASYVSAYLQHDVSRSYSTWGLSRIVDLVIVAEDAHTGRDKVTLDSKLRCVIPHETGQFAHARPIMLSIPLVDRNTTIIGVSEALNCWSLDIHVWLPAY